MSSPGQHAFSLYRAYLRQVRALPHVHLRLVFRIKGADDFRSVLKTKSVELGRKKLKRISKDLRRLRAANGGESTAFDRILDIAYGRAGKLRQELIEPLLSNPDAPLPPPNVIGDPPTYSPGLVALLTSGISRTTRALQKQHLASPPGLPERATPNAEDTRLLGPLSMRREHNIRWRFFKNEWKKNATTLRELFALAGSPTRLPSSPGKQRGMQATEDIKYLFDESLPARWLRRRYQALLGRVPLLIPRLSPRDASSRIYDVQLADNVITPSRSHPSRLRLVDATDISWISDVQCTIQSGRLHK